MTNKNDGMANKDWCFISAVLNRVLSVENNGISAPSFFSIPKSNIYFLVTLLKTKYKQGKRN